MVKRGNASAYTQDRQYGTQSHTHQVSGEEQADGNGDADIAEVEAVLRKSYGLMDAVRNCLYNAVSGIRDDPHVQRHGGTDTGQGNTEEQQDQL